MNRPQGYHFAPRKLSAYVYGCVPTQLDVEVHTAGAGSGVMEACEAGRGIYGVSRGENVGHNGLAIPITTTMVLF